MPICFQSALNFDPLPKNLFGVWGLEFGARLCSSPSLCGLEVINTEPNISRFGLQMFYLSIFTLQGSVGVTEHQRTGRKTLLKKQDMFINPAGKGFGGFFCPRNSWILNFSSQFLSQAGFSSLQEAEEFSKRGQKEILHSRDPKHQS